VYKKPTIKRHAGPPLDQLAYTRFDNSSARIRVLQTLMDSIVLGEHLASAIGSRWTSANASAAPIVGPASLIAKADPAAQVGDHLE
jgi:hypothetical protein